MLAPSQHFIDTRYRAPGENPFVLKKIISALAPSYDPLRTHNHFTIICLQSVHFNTILSFWFTWLADLARLSRGSNYQGFAADRTLNPTK